MKVLAMVLGLFITAANAGEIKIKTLSQFDLWGSRSAAPSFGINSALGRAWVEITISSYDPDGGSDEVERLQIEGMSYDTVTKSINIDHEGKITTCAQLKTVGRSIFRRQELVMTSECKFSTRWRTENYDNGFEVVKREKYEISLMVE